ncbi:fumarate hydratase [Kosmotoga pacifica]|uniref:Fumarate hydratase n=1 Tax=Kosmotoga pacifica TaxID=1330330 RepID=A0A0G2ZBZ4_9BACT|nr:fumarate hydratase [Kosmotoga pacifica]AKI97596.1 fumarate hydratase [Kosmotoga pacifica]
MLRESEIKNKLKQAIKRANILINKDVEKYVMNYDGPFSEVIFENIETSRNTGLPLCQDTGILEFFVFMGHEVSVEKPVCDILNRAVREVYTSEPYRCSVVSDPLFGRNNTGDNTPVICHVFQVTGKELEIRFIVKGGGSENLSALFMMRPSAGSEELKTLVVEHIRKLGANACPPLNIGIGIGGTAEKATLLSKLALTRPFGFRNPDERYAALEKEILESINDLKIGFQGLGKGITAYAVNIEQYPTHIATLPVALAVDCYLSRRGRIIIEDN